MGLPRDDTGANETGAGPEVPALEVREISKTYLPASNWIRRVGPGNPRVKQALQGVSLRVFQGEMVGLLGPNGAGKTTLSKIITTLVHASSGEVRLWGHDTREDANAARAMMGLVTCDERSFYWRLSGRQNLGFFGALYRVSKRDVAERGDELFAILGLEAAADAPYHTYSSGMKQKLAIARGLLSRPRLLIYDEPTRSLDPLSTQNIRRFIAAQRERFPEQTHLIATNQLDEAEQLCDRVFIINGGRLVAEGGIAEIRAQWDPSEVDSHVIDINGVYSPPPPDRRHPSVIGITVEELAHGARVRLVAERDGDALSVMLAHIIESGATVRLCTTEETSFDDVFCSLIESSTRAQRDVDAVRPQ